MTYLFNSNTSATISNEVEIKNDVGNAIPISGNINATIYNGVNKVTLQNPFPVTLGSNSITVIGNTNIIDTVTVLSTPQNPVHVHLSEVGASGNILTPYMPIGGNVTVLNPFNGNVNIISIPSVTISNPVSNVNIISIPSVTISNPVSNVNVTNTVNVTQGTSPWVVSGNVTMKTDANSAPVVSFADTIQMDPTDRLRVSLMGQQWWYVPAVDKDGDFRIQEKIQGAGASSTFMQNLSSVRLTSGQYYNANSQLTGTVVRASRLRHKTRPGVGSEWVGIINWDGLQSNVVKRVGMFTNYNGVFFEANSTTINAVVRRRLTDGTLLEDRTPHTAWSKDNMNGTGPSGYNWNNGTVIANVSSVLSVSNIHISGDGNVYVVNYQMATGEETKLTPGKKVTLTGVTPTGFNDTGLVSAIDTVNHRANVVYIAYPGTYSSASNAKMTHTPFHNMHTYWFDFNGSRTGRVRFGIHTDHGKVCLHEYAGGEIGSQWTSAPALMDRKEIINVAQTVDFLPSLTIGGSGISIETTAQINPGFGVAQSNTVVNFNKTSDVNKEYALLGIGIRAGEPYQRADVQLQAIQFVDIGNLNPQNAGIFQWRLVLNPTVSAFPSPTDIGKATHMWDYADGTTITGGIDLIGGYSQGTFTSDVKTALNFLNMGSNIDYTDSDIVVLAVKLVRGGSSDSSLLATINYIEDI